ncbi:MAG: rhodanese-like domain-containing protein [Cyanobacteria bacterium P01_A01_bin.114]
MVGINEAVDAVQEIAAEVSPAPATFDQVASAADLRARLNWGEPALTIIDVRDRESYNDMRITGAISLPVEELTQRAGQTLESNRDIYVYGDNDEATSGAALQLHSAGFERVSALRGGLMAWKANGGAIEGRKA